MIEMAIGMSGLPVKPEGRFSAHSKREELISLVKKLNPDKVVLIHGDKEAINWMGASILKQYPGKKVYAADNFKEIMFD